MMAQQNKEIPKHVAIIMDGNGRWGVEKYGERIEGHMKGAHIVREIVRSANDCGLCSVRLWAYSTDNWKRTENKVAYYGNEVNALMEIFKSFIIHDADELDAQDVRVTFVGRSEQLPEQLQQVMWQLEKRTADNQGLKVEVALNYGGVQSVVDAVKSLERKDVPVTDDSLLAELYPDIPPPELIIRTSGEMRTSGFQPLAVHAEWEFTDTLWPDFTVEEFKKILNSFGNRERRFGGVVKTA